MLRRVQHPRGCAGFDDAALLHHCDSVGDLRHHAEVVGDEQHAGAAALLDVLDQPQDLHLRRDIQRGGRFISDQQRGLQRERYGDHHALPLSA